MGLTTYNGLSILDATPVGDGGQALNNNFTTIADHLVLTTGNPHSVTAAQVGTYTASQIDIALSGKNTKTEYSLLDFGAIAGGGNYSANRIAFQNAISGLDRIGGGTLRVPTGVYHIDCAAGTSYGIRCANINNDIDIRFDPGAKINATGCFHNPCVALYGNPIRAFGSRDWNLGGSLLSLSMTRGSMSGVLVDDLGLAHGDTIFLSTQPYRDGLDGNNGATVWLTGNGDELWTNMPSGGDSRPQYYKGEYNIVDTYDNTNKIIYFQSSIKDDYTTNTTVAKLKTPKINLYNFTLEGDGTNEGLSLGSVRGGGIYGGRITGCRYTSYYLDYIYHYVIDSIITDDFYISGGGAQYGICAAGQESVIRNCRTFSGRHAIALGSNEPGRLWLIENCMVDNHRNTTQASFDTHEANEEITVNNCWIGNGLRLAGRNIYVTNCYINVRNAAFAVGFYPTKTDGHFTVRNSIIRGLYTETKNAVNYYVSCMNVETKNVNIDSCTVENCRNLFYMYNSIVATGCKLINCNINNTNANLYYATPASAPFFWNGRYSSALSYPYVENININGGNYSTNGTFEILYNNSDSYKTEFNIHNAKFEFRNPNALSLTFGSHAIGNVSINDTQFIGPTGLCYQASFDIAGYDLTLNSVKFKNFQENGGLYVNCNTLNMINCQHINSIGYPSLTATKIPNRYIKEVNFCFPGLIATGVNVTNPILMNYSGLVLKANAVASVAPSGGDINFGFCKNGTRIQTTANRLKLANLTTTATTSTFSDNNYTAGDYYTLDVDHVGSGYAGSQINVSLLTQYYIT